MNKRSQDFEAPIHHISSKKGKMVDFSVYTSKDDGESTIDDDISSVSKVRSFSVLSFLRKVFQNQLGDYAYDVHDGHKHMLFEITVRAALSESGFVEINPLSKSLIHNSNFHVQRFRYLSTFYFTLPNIIISGNTETVKIRFQNLGRYCRVYGCLVDGTTVHSVLLDKARLVLFLVVVWANFEQVIVATKATNRVTNIQPKKEVIKFWRKVKDELVLPLLTDVYEKVGLEPPLCFMQLPVEIKLKILDSVSGFDMARLSCVCSNLRCLVSSDELWKHKYFKQFGGFGSIQNDKWTYKELYATAWKNWEKWTKRLNKAPLSSYMWSLINGKKKPPG